MPRNLARSKVGFDFFSASSRTRSLNCSQEISRLTKTSGFLVDLSGVVELLSKMQMLRLYYTLLLKEKGWALSKICDFCARKVYDGKCKKYLTFLSNLTGL
jgi:hypothetical protein